VFRFRSRSRSDASDGARDAAFADLPLDRWPPDVVAPDVFPWSAFEEARKHLTADSIADAKRCWRSVIADRELEPRHHLQAWRFLREQGEHPWPDVAKQVLGVVVEVGVRKGVDLLAVYADRSVRYYNHGGGGVVLDRATRSLAEAVDSLLAAAAKVVTQIGPWEGPLPEPPRRGHARLSFLTPSGLHFGEAATVVLEKDALAGPVFQAATAVMTDLAATQEES
jgi:hypothetical protein